MDTRNNSQGLGRLIFLLSVGGGVLIALAQPVRADVVLAPQTVDPPPSAANEYPASSFGAAPSQPAVTTAQGTGAGVANPHSRDMDRGPAGFMFESDRKSVTQRAMAPEDPMGKEPQMKNEPDFKAMQEPAKLIENRRKGVQEVAVIANELGFFPRTIFVTQDTPVRLFVTGSSKSTLCIMIDAVGVRRQIRSHKVEEINFTPQASGKMRYYCPVNGLEGTIVVREIASTMPQQ